MMPFAGDLGGSCWVTDANADADATLLRQRVMWSRFYPLKDKQHRHFKPLLASLTGTSSGPNKSSCLPAGSQDVFTQQTSPPDWLNSGHHPPRPLSRYGGLAHGVPAQEPNLKPLVLSQLPWQKVWV